MSPLSAGDTGVLGWHVPEAGAEVGAAPCQAGFGHIAWKSSTAKDMDSLSFGLLKSLQHPFPVCKGLLVPALGFVTSAVSNSKQ